MRYDILKKLIQIVSRGPLMSFLGDYEDDDDDDEDDELFAWYG